MPIYEAECGKCGRQADYFAYIEQRNELVPDCCGQRMNRIITGAALGFVQKDIAYESPTTGRVITSHRARLDDLKRSRARPWEGLEQEKKEAARKRGYTEKKQEAQLEDAARRAWHQLPPAKRAALDGSE